MFKMNIFINVACLELLFCKKIILKMYYYLFKMIFWQNAIQDKPRLKVRSFQTYEVFWCHANLPNDNSPNVTSTTF